MPRGDGGWPPDPWACRGCGRRWRLEGLRVGWELQKAFGLGCTARRAAEVLACNYRTARAVDARVRDCPRDRLHADAADLARRLGAAGGPPATDLEARPHACAAVWRRKVSAVAAGGVPA